MLAALAGSAASPRKDRLEYEERAERKQSESEKLKPQQLRDEAGENRGTGRVAERPCIAAADDHVENQESHGSRHSQAQSAQAQYEYPQPSQEQKAVLLPHLPQRGDTRGLSLVFSHDAQRTHEKPLGIFADFDILIRMYGGTDLAKAGVYFFVHPGPFDPEYRHYALHALAQGLRRAGVTLYSNFHAEGFTFSPFRVSEDRTVVFSLTHLESWNQYAQAIAQYKGRKFLLCMADFANQIVPPDGSLGLMAHASTALLTDGPRVPWAFGLTDERIACCPDPGDFESRRPVLLRDFRPSAAQGVRLALDLSLLPHLAGHFTIDRELDAAHFGRLHDCQACLAYGGDFAENILRSHFYAQQPELREHLSRWRFVQEPAICRWDSWRFWESLVCGTLTIHIDLDKYGCQLPVMPKPWVHYIPVDLAEPKQTVDRMMEERANWAEIARCGREWALRHYSPDAVARRFLELAGGEAPDSSFSVSRISAGALSMASALAAGILPAAGDSVML